MRSRRALAAISVFGLLGVGFGAASWMTARTLKPVPARVRAAAISKVKASVGALRVFNVDCMGTTNVDYCSMTIREAARDRHGFCDDWIAAVTSTHEPGRSTRLKSWAARMLTYRCPPSAPS